MGLHMQKKNDRERWREKKQKTKDKSNKECDSKHASDLLQTQDEEDTFNEKNGSQQI